MLLDYCCRWVSLTCISNLHMSGSQSNNDVGLQVFIFFYFWLCRYNVRKLHPCLMSVNFEMS